MKPDYFPAALKRTFALFKRTEAVDEGAFRRLLNPVKEHLYNFIYKALNYSEDADDVYQETVLRAFKYRNSYNPGHSFKTWLFTIAHNEIKSHFNKSKTSSTTVDLEEHLNMIPHTGNENEEWVRSVYQIALELKPKQRKVFFLFYDHGFSIREIGRITGLKEGNIKFILNQSRQKIKDKLGVEND
ncbi:MAG: sigma-70 family RNA polymerase sigma factor [bacterium]|nr:sigma-70 family RNA polymerase sigma factor [bacterium]